VRAQEFIIDETAGEANTNPVQWVIRDAWESVYPTVALHTGDAGYGLNPVFASTKKKYVKDQEYLSGMRDRQGHFYLQLSAGYDGPEMVINILDANAGRFPGAVTKILNELFQYLEKEYGQGQQTFRTLTVGDDASGGAWDHIATKLNANADLHRGYNVKKNAKPDAAKIPTQVPVQ
jgi:hypothetical protein